MIIYNQICNYCGDQIELPAECEEDSFFKKDLINKSKVYGICIDMVVTPIKSFEGYRRRNVKSSTFSFCGKDCFVEFVKKSITEEGSLENTK